MYFFRSLTLILTHRKGRTIKRLSMEVRITCFTDSDRAWERVVIGLLGRGVSTEIRPSPCTVGSTTRRGEKSVGGGCTDTGAYKIPNRRGGPTLCDGQYNKNAIIIDRLFKSSKNIVCLRGVCTYPRCNKGLFKAFFKARFKVSEPG